MKLPMNRKMIGSANGASTVRALPTCRTTASIGPMSAVMASGSASVTHSTTIMARMAASLCAPLASGIGSSNRTMSTSGPPIRPAVRRRRLNNSSAGEYASLVSTAS